MQKKEKKKTEETKLAYNDFSSCQSTVSLDIYVDFVDFYSSLFDIQRDATSCRDIVRDLKTRNAGFRIQLADRRERTRRIISYKNSRDTIRAFGREIISISPILAPRKIGKYIVLETRG